MSRLVVPIMVAVLLTGGSAYAQKNSGPLLPSAPPPYPALPRTTPTPTYREPVRPSPVTSPGNNPDVERQSQALPIDPQTREMRDQMPADPRGIERRLGLREARGPATDLRGRNATTREIVDALAPR